MKKECIFCDCCGDMINNKDAIKNYEISIKYTNNDGQLINKRVTMDLCTSCFEAFMSDYINRGFTCNE